MTAGRAEEKKLLLHVDLDEQLPASLLGDPVKIGQILTNLVSNAIKFTDVHMPELDGHAAAQAIRQLPDERLRQIPIIALSASARAWQQSRIKASGFTDFIGKPFDADELFRRMALHTSRELPSQGS